MKGQNRGCCGSTEWALVVPRRSWRDIFLEKSGNRHNKEKKTGKKRKRVRPVETGAADGNPPRTRIPIAA